MRQQTLQLLHGFSLVLRDVEITVVGGLEHGHYGVKATAQQWCIGQLQPHAVHREGKLRIRLWYERFLSRVREKLIRIQRAGHELEVDVAAPPHLSHVGRRRTEGCVSNHDDLAELVALVGAGNVRGLDKFLASSADTLHCVL